VNSKHLDASFGLNALSAKLSILISAICLIAGLTAAYLMVKSERKQLLFEEYGVLTELSKPFIERFENLLDEKKRIAVDANTIVTEALYSEKALAEKVVPSKLVFGKDGSIRSSSSTNVAGVRSAAFLPQQNYSHEYKRIFAQTEQVWSQLAPILTDETFFNYYFISQDRFIRISPPNWALNVPANHDFRQDVFYEIGTPQANPNLEASWTPIYYDDIWERWVISLIVPLHYGGEFKGITGSDIELPKLQAMFPDKVGDAKLFVLNSAGQIIQFEGKTDIITRIGGTMNDELDTKNQLPVELRSQIDSLLANNRNESQGEFSIDDSKHIFSIQKFSDFDWYIGVYKTHSEALSAIDEIEVKFFGLFILYAVLVVLLLHQTLSHLVIKRIKALVSSSREVARGQFETAQKLAVNKDEIGLLNFEFGAMAGKLEKTMGDLRQELAEKEVAEQRARRLSKAVEFSGSAVVITDEHLNIEYVNPKLIEMTGFEKDHFIGQPLLVLMEPDMMILVEDIVQDLLARHHWKGDTLLHNTDKRALWVSLSVSPIRDDNHKVYSYVASAQDISFVKESQRKMEQLAYYDTLTGLANRALFRMQLKKSLALASRGHYSFALFYFDLDEFKRINDTLGHDAGDQLLLEVAQRLQKRLRAEDTIARLGGDEFAVLLSGINDRDQAADVALTIQNTLSQPIRLGSNEVIVSASIGITMASEQSPEEDVLLKHADLAMYEAKALGKNTYYFYNDTLDAAAKERLFIENELRIGIKEQQFELYYQPQININNEQIVGFEALIRWHHPTLGYIAPDKFIPIAEATGLIVELGEWVLWESCAFAQRMALKDHGSNISINLSARQFKDTSLIPLLEKVIAKTGIDAARIHLELTESMLMGDVEGSIKQMHQLKALGVSLSIDDFGTGYSSLSYLKRFPLDILKIDRSFIKDIPEDSNDMEITAAIIAMAQKLNLELVAEGVESEEQIDFLKINNCEVVQGYFYSKPVPEHEISLMVDKIQGNGF